MIDQGGQERVLSTHERVAQKLEERKKSAIVDISKMESVKYPPIDEIFYVGAMDYDKHKEWQDVKSFEITQHTEANKTENEIINRKRSDIILLANAVYTEDGKSLGSNLAAEILVLKASGPAVYTLLSAAEKANPPREYLAIEVALLMSKSSFDCLVWRLMLELGLGKMLVDYMSTRSTPEEKKWAEEQIDKVTEVAYAFQPMFEAEETAKMMNLSFRDSMKLISAYGTSEEVAREKAKLEENSPTE